MRITTAGGVLHGEQLAGGFRQSGVHQPDTLSETGQIGQTQTYYRVNVHLPSLQVHDTETKDIVVKIGTT